MHFAEISDFTLSSLFVLCFFVRFRAAKPGEGRKGALMIASQPFCQQFSFFELGDKYSVLRVNEM
jgi:hypothetical protein